MIAIIIAGATAFLLSIVGTPLFIKLLVRKSYGQFIRDDGPTSHATKRGTPTMGGVAIILATILGYGLSHLFLLTAPSISILLVLFLIGAFTAGPARLTMDCKRLLRSEWLSTYTAPPGSAMRQPRSTVPGSSVMLLA